MDASQGGSTAAVIQLDDDYLDSVGLGGMPAEDRQSFLQHLYETLELRVGTAMSDGLSDAQLEEFESIIDRDQACIAAWLDTHAPGFLGDPLYRRYQLANPDAKPVDVVCQYAGTKWLEVNRPGYKDIVHAVLAALTEELIARAPELRAGFPPATRSVD